MNNYSIGGFVRPPHPCGKADPPSSAPHAGDEAPSPAERDAGRVRADARLVVDVARLYHEQRLTQKQIAAQLRLSQGTVCRLLQKAEEHGIVRVTVSPPHGAFVDLEELLERKFGLAQVIIAKAGWDHAQPVQSALGAAAAHFLEMTLKSRDVIGVASESATLLAMVEQMHPVGKVCDCEVVQILGGLGDPAAGKYANHLVSQLATLTRGHAHFLTAPGLMDSRAAVAVVAEDPQICDTVARFARITVALVGIGPVEPPKWLAARDPRFSVTELQTLEAKAAVGQICLRFYDLRGEEVDSPLGGRVFGLDSTRLRTIPRVVGIAGGKPKRQAILGALRGRWVNVLITDEFSAEALARA